MQQNRRGRNGWIGWVIFALVIFGPRFLGPVASTLSQATGLPISTGVLLATIIGLGVVGSIVSSIVREVNRGRSSTETRLPTGMPPSMPPPAAPPPTVARPPSTPGGVTPLRLPPGEQRLPGPPRFEPIIDPRILTWGILGLILFGGFFLVALYFL